MRVRWFGEPWPSAELRAPICDDDEYRVPVPVGYRCSYCDKVIDADDQGVVMAYGGPLEDDLTFSIVVEDERPHARSPRFAHDQLVVAEHLECMLYSTLGYDPRKR